MTKHSALLALVVSLAAVPTFAPVAASAAPAATAPAPRDPPDPNLTTSPIPARPIIQFPWSPDAGDGTFKNPILFADYSDPDVVRVNDDFYMTASSFSCFPGLPVLHSKDLVNWTLIGHALQHYPAPFRDAFKSPQHGAGVWAPSFRHHNGEFYIYFGDPDFGVFMTKAKDPKGPWEPLHLVKAAKGWIDTCPFWDDDGNAYLVHGFARSRAGIKNRLDICKMAPDGKSLLDEGTTVFDGDKHPARYSTVEGPKLYKRNGFYYILAPGGGVEQGYQLAFRAQSILGPYDAKIVMDRGTSPVNGPHQGGWVDTPDSKEHWFVHFQDVRPYGRAVHLNPLTWTNDWPVIGEDPKHTGRGQPVLTFKKPNVGKNYPVAVPQTSDDFDAPTLGLQWQWWSDFQDNWASTTARKGFLRLTPVSLDKNTLLYNRANLLLQKFPADTFMTTATLDLANLAPGESAGLVLAGKTMSAIHCTRTDNTLHLRRTNYNANDRRSTADAEEATATLPGTTVTLRLVVGPNGVSTLLYGPTATSLAPLGKPVTAINGTWIGAKVGLFANAPTNTSPKGFADIDSFHFDPAP